MFFFLSTGEEGAETTDLSAAGNALGSASSDLEQSSSVSGGDADADERTSSSDRGDEAATPPNPASGSLFIKRSVDEDFANNNSNANNNDNDVDDVSMDHEDEADLKESGNGKKEESGDSLMETEESDVKSSPPSALPLPPQISSGGGGPMAEQLK